MGPFRDRAVAGAASPTGEVGRLAAGRAGTFRSLSSATLAIGSAATFLVLVTLASFLAEDGPNASPARLADHFLAWELRGSLPASDAAPPPRERMAQGAPS